MPIILKIESYPTLITTPSGRVGCSIPYRRKICRHIPTPQRTQDRTDSCHTDCAKTGNSSNDPFADVATSCHSARMRNRGLSILCVLAVLAAGALWWAQFGAMTDDQRLLFSKLDAAIANTPPRASDLIEAFGLPETCREKTCYLQPGKIGGLRYDGGNLRQSEDGLVFVLEGLAGSCIRTDQAQAYYSAGKPEERCSHGGCWSTQAQYSWGILGFGLGKPNSQCVTSIAINSLPYQRRKQ